MDVADCSVARAPMTSRCGCRPCVAAVVSPGPGRPFEDVQGMQARIPQRPQFAGRRDDGPPRKEWSASAGRPDKRLRALSTAAMWSLLWLPGSGATS